MKLTEIWGYCILGCALGLMLGAFGQAIQLAIGTWIWGGVFPVFVCVVSAYVILPRFQSACRIDIYRWYMGHVAPSLNRYGMGASRLGADTEWKQLRFQLHVVC